MACKVCLSHVDKLNVLDTNTEFHTMNKTSSYMTRKKKKKRPYKGEVFIKSEQGIDLQDVSKATVCLEDV